MSRFHFMEGNLTVSEDSALILLQEGIAAAKAGNKALAYPLLREATELAPDCELAWLWLAGVCETPKEAAIYLQRVLEMNPSNEHAQAGLKWARREIEVTGEAREEEMTGGWNCPFCQSLFPSKIDRCPVCEAFLTLTDLDALLNNTRIHKAEVLEAIERLAGISEADADFDTHFHLALAHLNLKQVEEGITHLQAAIHMRPGERMLQTQLEDLSLRLAAMEIADKDDEKRGVVLVVDDSPTICKLVEITLEKQGYQVIAASDGLDGMARLNDGLPDLILLDITMPRMDGYQLCKIIKGNPEIEDIPVIMLSGKDGFFDKVKGRMAGSSEYITKPFEPEELVRVVGEHIAQMGV